MSFHDAILSRLGTLETAGLMRRPRLFESRPGRLVRHEGRDVLSFCSNDYLGLAGHPALGDALAEGAREWGAGSGASRHVSGSYSPHARAQRALAEWVGAPSALLFSTGYAANLGTIQALVGPGDLVFSDSLNHASLIDGCRLSRAQIHVYPHRDCDALAALLQRHRHEGAAALVVTDSLFSMDGDVAPLRALRALCDRHDAGLLVDDAHAIGVFGPDGAGLCAEQEIVPDVLVGTLGKSLGLAGAFVAGAEPLVRLVENRARSYVFSTAPPPALAHAVPRAIELARDPSLRARTLAHAQRARAELPGVWPADKLLPGSSPILPLLVGDPGRVMELSAALLAKGVFVHGIRPPTVPQGSSRLRVVVTAAHTHDDVTTLLRSLSELR